MRFLGNFQKKKAQCQVFINLFRFRPNNYFLRQFNVKLIRIYLTRIGKNDDICSGFGNELVNC